MSFPFLSLVLALSEVVTEIGKEIRQAAHDLPFHSRTGGASRWCWPRSHAIVG